MARAWMAALAALLPAAPLLAQAPAAPAASFVLKARSAEATPARAGFTHTGGGNIYVRLLLGIQVRDATAGFRLFRASTLRAIDLDTVRSAGYVFQTDLTWRTLQAGLRVCEVAIEFVERERGDSKMSRAVAVESLQRITVWGIAERRAQLARMLGRGAETASGTGSGTSTSREQVNR